MWEEKPQRKVAPTPHQTGVRPDFFLPLCDLDFSLRITCLSLPISTYQASMYLQTQQRGTGSEF